MLQISRVTAITVYELLMENQLHGKITHPLPHPIPCLGLIKQNFLDIDPKAIQQIVFLGNLARDRDITVL